MAQKRKHPLVNILRARGAKSEVRFCVFGSQVNGSWRRGGVLLHVASVSVRWRRRRWRQLLVVPLLRGRNVGQHEGVGGASADAKGSQAAQVAGRPRQPHLGPLRRSHRVAVKLALRQPRRDLHLFHGVQVRHEDWVLNPSWMRERK